MEMENNGYECAILEDGRETGRLTVEPSGAYQLFHASCRSGKHGVLRLLARCEGKDISLGVLTPGDGEYTLLRRFSPAERRRMGLTRAESCRIAGEEASLWEQAERGWELFSEPELRECCRGIAGLRCRRNGEDTLLAVPLLTPFPLMPIFCLASYLELDGAPYLVFCFRNGELTLCESEKVTGIEAAENGT